VLVWAKFQDGVARPLGGDLQMQMANPPAPAGNAPAPAGSAPVPAPAGSAPLPAAPATAPATGG
jgi:hypothetical protein